MVNNYLIDKCKYRLGSLKAEIWLLSSDAKFDVDYQRQTVTSYSASEVICIKGESTKANVNENEEGRLRFSSTVSFTVNENDGELINLMTRVSNGKWFVAVKDKENTTYIQSSEFASEVSMQFTISEEGNAYEIKLEVSDNHPFMEMPNGATPSYTYDKFCGYNTYGIKSFKIGMKDYTLVDNSNGEFTHIKLTDTEQLSLIQPLKGTFAYTYEKNATESLLEVKFGIYFEQYRHAFRYDMAKFMENRYVVLVETPLNIVYGGGFLHGLQCSYEVETADEEGEANIVTVTLRGTAGNISFGAGGLIIEEDFSDHFSPPDDIVINPQSGERIRSWECIDKYTAIYTLLEMYTASGRATGKYLCLEGYEEKYRGLDIIGTYTKDEDFGFPLTFESDVCIEEYDCGFEIFSPTRMTFNYEGETQTLTIRSKCDWQMIDKPDWVDFNIKKGDGGRTYEITVECIRQPPSEGSMTGRARFDSGDNTRYIYFTLEKKRDLASPKVFNITAQAQMLNSKIDAPLNGWSVCREADGVVTLVSGDGLYMMVSENESDVQRRTFEIDVCSVDGRKETIVINQDHLYTDWREDGQTICVGQDLYKRVTKYKGYTASTVNIRTDETRAGELIQKYSEQCGYQPSKEREEWIPDGGSICIDGNLYQRLRRRYTKDDGLHWETTDEYKAGDLLFENFAGCQGETQKTTKWIVDYMETVCVDGKEYYLETLYYSEDNGNTWIQKQPKETRTSSVIAAEDSKKCGGTQEDVNYAEKYVETDDTVCSDGTLYYVERLYVSLDGGVKWEATDMYRLGRTAGSCYDDRKKVYQWVMMDDDLYICDGYDSYRVERLYWHYEDDARLYLKTPIEDRKSTMLIQKNDSDCGYVGEEIFRWTYGTDDNICQDGDLYVYEREQVSTDGGKTWKDTGNRRLGRLIESGSAACKEPEPSYERWVLDGDVCEEMQETPKGQYCFSYECSGGFGAKLNGSSGWTTITNTSGSGSYCINEKVTSCVSMFENMSTITLLDFSAFDFSEVTTMNSMFAGLTNLETVIFGTSDCNPSSYSNMFYSCNNIKSIQCTKTMQDNILYRYADIGLSQSQANAIKFIII